MRENAMQNTNWEDFDFDELAETTERKENKKKSSRKWREIEAFKDRQRERKAMDLNDHYYLM